MKPKKIAIYFSYEFLIFSLFKKVPLDKNPNGLSKILITLKML